MIWFGKNFINVVRALFNLIKLVSTLTCSLGRVRCTSEIHKNYSDILFIVTVQNFCSRLESSIVCACQLDQQKLKLCSWANDFAVKTFLLE